jgi:hypothetical protein
MNFFERSRTKHLFSSADRMSSYSSPSVEVASLTLKRQVQPLAHRLVGYDLLCCSKPIDC